MADQKLQARRALIVVPSDTIDIPLPASKRVTGTQTSATANKLTNTNATFTDGTVKKYDIVYDTTGNSIATVTAIDSATVLSLSADIFTATENYVIYDGEADARGYDAVIYVGVSGDVTVVTSGDDVVTYKNMPTGMFIPVNVKRVNSTGTTATDLVAHW